MPVRNGMRIGLRRRFATIGALLAGGALGAVPLGLAAHGASELDDAAVRIQYAYYTEDAQSLEQVLRAVQELEASPALASAKAYQLAYGYWKLAQLQARRGLQDPALPATTERGERAAQACARHAQLAIAADPAYGEAYALEAVCKGFSPARGKRAPARSAQEISPDTGTTIEPADLVFGGAFRCAHSRSLRKALALAPASPRVRLIEALCASAADGGLQAPAALARWRAVVVQFESARPTAMGTPDWGHVEALTTLGALYLQRGDPIAARDLLERALVLVPDYRAAQKLLQTAAARPH